MPNLTSGSTVAAGRETGRHILRREAFVAILIADVKMYRVRARRDDRLRILRNRFRRDGQFRVLFCQNVSR